MDGWLVKDVQVRGVGGEREHWSMETMLEMHGMLHDQSVRCSGYGLGTLLFVAHFYAIYAVSVAWNIREGFPRCL